MVLCSANCIHNDNDDYYNICHKYRESGYGGIVRSYTSGCPDKCPRPSVNVPDILNFEIILNEGDY